MRVWKGARQFTTWVTPSSGRRWTEPPTGMLPIATRSPSIQLNPSSPRIGP